MKQCKKCKTPLTGGANYCVLCYSRMHKPCPMCNPGGKLNFKFFNHGPTKTMLSELAKTGNMPKCHRCGTTHKEPFQLVCTTCNNERFILIDDQLPTTQERVVSA